MSKNIFVGSLAWATTSEGLERAFSQYGSVTSAKVITDRETGRSKGFGFVEMSSDEEAENAISALNGKELDGRAIVVNEARPPAPRSGGFGGGGGGGRGGYGGGGGGGRGGFGGGGGRGGGGRGGRGGGRGGRGHDDDY